MIKESLISSSEEKGTGEGQHRQAITTGEAGEARPDDSIS